MSSENETHDENKTKKINSYKNIHNPPKDDMTVDSEVTEKYLQEEFAKKDSTLKIKQMATVNEDSVEPDVSEKSIMHQLNITSEEDDEDDEDDEDYEIDEDEENEVIEDDYFDRNEYEQEVIGEYDDEEDTFYFDYFKYRNKNMEELIPNEIECDTTNNMHRNEHHKIKDNRIEKNFFEENDMKTKKDIQSESCYSCSSQKEINCLQNFAEENVSNDNTDFSLDVMHRIDEIYYKETKYKNLKEVNNKNNSICLNDLNLNIISDYLNVDISVFHKKCTILLIGNTQSGKSSFVNWITENYVQNTNCLRKRNQITYVDVKNNFKFNLKNLSNEAYQLGFLNKLQNNWNVYNPYRPNCGMENSSKNVIITGEQCNFLFKPFSKLKNKIEYVTKYIRAKVCMQNNFTKYINRINSVSFIDTSGINDTDDSEYDDIIMNLAKYVDLVFIFIDTNKYAINTRLLKIINHVMDYHINKATICLTRIDLVKKVDLYRIVFYLTQFFLRNLNIFKMDILSSYQNYLLKGNSNERTEEEETKDNKEEMQWKHDGKLNGIDFFLQKKRNALETEWNYMNDFNLQKKTTDNPLGKSIGTFKNVTFFSKFLKRAFDRKALDKAIQLTSKAKEVSTSIKRCFSSGEIALEKKQKGEKKDIIRRKANIKHNLEKANSFFSYSKNKVNEEFEIDLNEKEDENKEEDEEFSGGILKKILTKRFSSFKEKILDDNLLKQVNKAKSFIEKDSDVTSTEEEDEKETESESNEENESETETELDEYAESSVDDYEDSFNPKQSAKKRMSVMNTQKNKILSKRKLKYSFKDHLNDKVKKKKSKKKKRSSWKTISYIDCIKNLCIFTLVLVYGIAKTTYNIFYRLIKSYFGNGAKSSIENEDLKQEEDEGLTKNIIIENGSHEILEFFTIYLPEIPRDVFKIEKWKFDANNIKVDHNRRQRFSCNSIRIPNANNEFSSEIQTNKKNLQRRSIPMEVFENESIPRVHGKRASLPNKMKLRNVDTVAEKNLEVNPNKSHETLNSSQLHELNSGSNFDEIDHMTKKPYVSKEFAFRRLSQPGNRTHDNQYQNMHNSGPKERRHRFTISTENSQDINDNEGKNINFLMHNGMWHDKKRYMNYNNMYGYGNDYANRSSQNETAELNMIQELLFKIDESIDLKTNQSIYLLKKDLQNIQENCLKRIADNNEILKKNKSVQMRNIQFYFFKYMAIVLGFFISLLRYDLLVYFNFINTELLFSIFSKYFLFLSSYNKHSLFIMANIILVVAYSMLYFRYKKRNYFKSLDKSDLNKLKIILLFTQIIFDEINQLHMKLLGKKPK